MQISNKDSYISTIYSAIVVNKDKSQDPDNKDRIQIYLPSVNYEYEGVYQDYIKDNNKPNSTYYDKFPWAITLIEEVQEGDEVYGSYIEGDATQFILLGLAGGKSNVNTGGANVDTSNVVNLAMPIILHNEIGIDISAWTNDSIPEEKYRTITLHDGGEYNKATHQWIKQGTWAIGLIQWNGARAYDLCYNIAKDNSSWKESFTSDVSLKSDLIKSMNVGNSNSQRSRYSSGFNPEKGGETYNAILTLISSEVAKQTQKRLAYNDTADTINMLIEKGCNNPAVLIYLADFFNQYGSGYSGTIQEAVNVCSIGSDYMQQLDKLISFIKTNFKSTFNTYKTRRDATYTYIQELYNAGKLVQQLLVDDSNSTGYTPISSGQYCMPFKGTYRISAQWGKKGYAGGYTGYSSGSGHSGIDFACPSGTTLYACTNGKVEKAQKLIKSYGVNVQIRGDDGNLIIYAHMSDYKVYVGQRVSKGDIIGYSGNSGNSHGAHLHFEIRPKQGGDFSLNMWGSTNPAPYLSIGGHTNDMVTG